MEILIFYFLVAVGIIILPKYSRYRGSKYKIASGNSFFKTVFDKGNYGEFLTFSYLEKLGKQNKLMTNIYLPKADGSTTEVDLIMLSETGIYVFESKNYSGWIFGDEKNKNWTQSLQNKQKNKFYNPIWQNKGHISALKDTLGINKEDFYKSYIIFSERCTL
ncbi:nuclease-related domain-containing protein, partial [Clostridium grantii]